MLFSIFYHMKEFITAFDVETTGVSQKEDYIIQLSAIKFRRDTFEVVKTFDHYIKPCLDYTIKDGALGVHGLTKEFIEENGVPLKSVAPEFLEMWEDADVLTFNGNRFDINMLYKDLMLIGIELNLEDKIFYDSYGMEVRLAPRNLGTVYKKYTGLELEGAHNSLNDITATIEVFKNQLEVIDLLEEDKDVDVWPENQLTSPEGSIRNSAQRGEPDFFVFNIGKYKDCEFMEVCKKDPQYISWFKDKVASPYTWRKLSKYYREHRNEQRG